MKTITQYLLIAYWVCLFLTGSYARTQVDSISLRLDTVQSVEAKLNVLHELIQAYTYSEPGVADSLAREGLRIARAAEDLNWQGIMLYESGLSLSQRGIYGAALKHFDRAREIFELQVARDSSFEIRVAYVLNQIGVLHHNRAEYGKALEAYQSALSIKKQLLEQKGGRYAETAATTYSNIGLVYKDLDLVREALSYFEISEQIYEQYMPEEGSALSRNQAIVFGNLLEIYLEMGQLEQAEVYHRKSYYLNQALNDPSAMCEYFDNEGDIARAREEWDRAVVAYNHALEQCVKSKNQFEEALLHAKLGDLYLERSSPEKAEKHYRAGQLIALDIDARQLVANSFRHFSMLHEARGNLNDALDSYKQYVEAEAAIFNDRTVDALREVNATWSPERAEDQVKLLSLEKELQDRQIQLNHTQSVAILVVLAMLIVLFVVMFMSFRQKQGANQLLEKKNDELQAALDRLHATVIRLTESEAELKAANSAKNKLFSVISHDLRGQLGGIMTFASLLKDRAAAFTPDQLRRFTQEFYRAATGLFELFENLLSWSTSQMDQPVSSRISMREAIEKNLSIHAVAAQAKHLHLVSNCDDQLYGYADKNILHFLLRNLISNAIKFSNFGGEVCVSAHRVPNGVKVAVSDQGIGMSEAVCNQLFLPGKHPTTVGTNKEKGAGLGLLLCHEFVQKMGSEFEVDSILGEGTCISFVLKDLRLESPVIEVQRNVQQLAMRADPMQVKS